ncbi:aldo/keto reductase [Xanthovirga aplysinae]|uniref:aldo/keto reductase n=1 Tax=Xanthovirga aplysinae TaxID=2529853 RepID=UPI0012BB7AD6|nr:aldo/keto reductase [Xanthovirga aplysinae]MTI31498.1 aldo/keto reductase [Xanthovirga aplysinae]
MNYRTLGKTGFEISEISLGTWQVGGKWGAPFCHENADQILNLAADSGINFIDTADVYGDGESEKAVGKFVRSHGERIYVASKCGRRLNPHVGEAYQPRVLRKFVEDSLKNTGLEVIDLMQLHCAPTEVYYRPEIFELFDRLIEEGKILNFGVSVEKVEEALKAIEYSNVSTVQIIFNMFRHRPIELFFEQAQRKNIGVIARVPLASGILTGKFHKDMSFSKGDHRFFNREGQAFDKGESFSGVDFEIGLEAVEKLKGLFPESENFALVALRWILMFREVSCVIPGASRPEQLSSNLSVMNVPDFSDEQVMGIKQIYEHYIKPQVHHYW